MTTNLGWLLTLATLSLYVCYTDVKQRQVTNNAVLLVSLICLSLLVVNQQYLALMHAFVILAVGIGLFVLGIIAAGDIKLLAAFSLAIKPTNLPMTLCLILLIGGVQAVLYLIYGAMTDLKTVRQKGIPYAIPICLGSLFGIAASL